MFLGIWVQMLRTDTECKWKSKASFLQNKALLCSYQINFSEAHRLHAQVIVKIIFLFLSTLTKRQAIAISTKNSLYHDADPQQVAAAPPHSLLSGLFIARVVIKSIGCGHRSRVRGTIWWFPCSVCIRGICPFLSWKWTQAIWMGTF